MTPTRDVPDPRRWWALALLCSAFLMVLLDGTIVLVALSSIQADIGFSDDGLQWVLSASALTFGGLLPDVMLALLEQILVTRTTGNAERKDNQSGKDHPQRERLARRSHPRPGRGRGL